MADREAKQLALISVDDSLHLLGHLPKPVEPGMQEDHVLRILCDRCRQGIAVDEFFGCATYHWPEMPEPNVFSTPCPFCHFLLQYQVKDGWILFGYTYAAGRAHFANVRGEKMNGLIIAPHEDSIIITLNGSTWDVPKRL